MRIVKPYGRSHVERDAAGKLRRVLGRRPDPAKDIAPDNRHDIETFARSHDALVIAQWISAIDKIAAKPKGENGATEEQRKFRERLGAAAWKVLGDKKLLRGLAGLQAEQLEKLWAFKLEPYGSTSYRPTKGAKPPGAKGRWFKRFAGEIEAVEEVDASAIASKIHEHLYIAEYKLRALERTPKHGLIDARARSIADNTARGPRTSNSDGWSEDDERAYARAGDVASDIRRAAEQRESGGAKNRLGRVGGDIAGSKLYEHYAKVFPGREKPLSIEEAKAAALGLFNLHMAVKDCYARILKDHKKDLPEHGQHRRKISLLLPNAMAKLFELVRAKNANRDLGALVRLGKIIHYEASVGEEDRPKSPVDKWPANIAASRFWTSDGQAAIKRNEAFVRVWRYVLALAARTLTDWADPKGEIGGDILVEIKNALKLFDAGVYARKLDLMFGSRAGLFKRPTDEAFEKDVLRSALEGVAALRHTSFHFKGLGGFSGELTSATKGGVTAPVAVSIAELWRADFAGRAERMRDALRAAHCEYFFKEHQNRKLFAALFNPSDGKPPLPRFNRVLARAEGAWKTIGLPATANRLGFEKNPARLCQYAALKLLYDRPFRTWLKQRDFTALNGYIDRAVKRGTAVAREKNAGGHRGQEEMIVAKAGKLGRLKQRESVETFFERLSGETASEMRVQRGYDSDADNARAQAGFIENLKCDVVLLAFEAYARQSGFAFILDLKLDQPKPAKPLWSLDALEMPASDDNAAAWTRRLYFLLHLIPVEAVGLLLHQIRKWDLLAAKDPKDADGAVPTAALAAKDAEDAAPAAAVSAAAAVGAVQTALELYLDMHDAKFEGGAALIGCDAFKSFFERQADFDRIFPKADGAAPGASDERRVARRALREIMRFGDLTALHPLLAQHRVKEDEVDAYLAMERASEGKPSPIAELQEKREGLHDKWALKKKQFTDADRDDYKKTLAEVVKHRHLAAQATLANPVRLHRLMMAALGRLVDFSGLWERDLYFATLALINEQGIESSAMFGSEGLKAFKDGQIVKALQQLAATKAPKPIRDGLTRYFEGDAQKRDGYRPANAEVRNAIAHFNMLRPEGGIAARVDLTALINRARGLMAYDRKLKNAVSKAIAELLHREGLTIRWTMSGHDLAGARLATRQARHLGDKSQITEDLHGPGFVAMAAALFGGVA